MFVAAASVLLPLPYLVPTGTFMFASPICALALSWYVGAWKLFDLAIGTAPPAARASLSSMIVRTASLLEFRCTADGLPERAQPGEWRHHVRTFGYRALGSAALSSAVALLGAALPYGLRVYADTWATFFFLALAGDTLALALSLLGYAPQPLFFDPLTRASSPADFWGRRWNLLIHGLFKRSVHGPLVRRGAPAAAAAALAFGVSGAFHEYAFLAPAAARANGGRLGVCLLFFALQAPMVTMEKLLGWEGAVSRLAAALRLGPSGRAALATALTCALLMPLAPLFMATPEASGLTAEMRSLFPRVVPRDPAGGGAAIVWSGWDIVLSEAKGLLAAPLSAFGRWGL